MFRWENTRMKQKYSFALQKLVLMIWSIYVCSRWTCHQVQHESCFWFCSDPVVKVASFWRRMWLEGYLQNSAWRDSREVKISFVVNLPSRQMRFRKPHLGNSWSSVQKERSQIPLESAAFLFAGQCIAKRILHSFGVGHLLVAVSIVAHMSQLD